MTEIWVHCLLSLEQLANTHLSTHSSFPLPPVDPTIYLLCLLFGKFSSIDPSEQGLEAKCDDHFVLFCFIFCQLDIATRVIWEEGTPIEEMPLPD